MDQDIELEEIIEGEVKEEILPGYQDEIKSNHIISFEYQNSDYYFSCELEDNKIHIISKGGYSNKRDGRYFHVDYQSENLDFLNQLQRIVRKYQLSNQNGYCLEVSGLPEGLGDYLEIKYDTKERIRKENNQSRNLEEEPIQEIYQLFLEETKAHNLDFTSKGSNVLLYDDANEEYLQGLWKGNHFGEEIEVIFQRNQVKIIINNQITDDIEYVIIEGNIRPKILKNQNKNPENQYDYEEFQKISNLKKKNDHILVAYFYHPAYSTCELLRQ